MKSRFLVFIIVILIYTINIYNPEYIHDANASWQDNAMKEFARIADSKQKQAQEKSQAINRLYTKGRSHYNSRRYREAKSCFDQILEIEPSYEPAKLFLESVVIQEGVLSVKAKIEAIKIQMADIIAEYDKRVQRTDSLAVKYFLEQAQQECQIGNFSAAEKYYNLCYKVYPFGKDRLEWFVEATHDLTLLYMKLEEENRGMEELMASLR
jgi:outer membrane protein assembly factor BamD (BamD/ComL family)